MKRPKRITAKYLESLGACERAVRTFRQVYPHGVKVTQEAVEAYICRAKRDTWCGRVNWLCWLLAETDAARDARRAWREIDNICRGRARVWRPAVAQIFVLIWKKQP